MLSAEMTGKDIADVYVSLGTYNQPLITIEFDVRGATRFAEITRNNIRRRLAINSPSVCDPAPCRYLSTSSRSGREANEKKESP